MGLQLREYWDKAKTLEEFKLYITKYKTFSATMLLIVNRYLYHMLFFRFRSYTKARNTIERNYQLNKSIPLKNYSLGRLKDFISSITSSTCTIAPFCKYSNA